MVGTVGLTKIITAGAPVYLASVLEHLCAEILKLAGNRTFQSARSLITIDDVLHGVNDSVELDKLLGGVTFNTSDDGPRVFSNDYIPRMLMSIHPGMDIADDCMPMMRAYINDVLRQIATEAGRLATFSSLDIQTAVGRVLAKPLAERATLHAGKALDMFLEEDEVSRRIAAKAGIHFPIGHIESHLQCLMPMLKRKVAVYLTGAVECLCGKILAVAAHRAVDKMIVPYAIDEAIAKQEHISKLWESVYEYKLELPIMALYAGFEGAFTPAMGLVLQNQTPGIGITEEASDTMDEFAHKVTYIIASKAMNSAAMKAEKAPSALRELASLTSTEVTLTTTTEEPNITEEPNLTTTESPDLAEGEQPAFDVEDVNSAIVELLPADFVDPVIEVASEAAATFDSRI